MFIGLIGCAGVACTSRQTDPDATSRTTEPAAATQPAPLAAAKPPAPTPAPPAKEAEPEVFEYPAAKLKLKYPGGWKKKNEPENVLSVSPKPDDPAAPELSVAIPKLPFHIKGMIPLGPVKGGYLDDLKKRLSNVKEADCPAVKIAGAGGTRRFIAEGKDPKLGDRKIDVLLITRGDTLFVISSEASTAGFDTAHSAMECVVGSLEWIN